MSHLSRNHPAGRFVYIAILASVILSMLGPGQAPVAQAQQLLEASSSSPLDPFSPAIALSTQVPPIPTPTPQGTSPDKRTPDYTSADLTSASISVGSANSLASAMGINASDIVQATLGTSDTRGAGLSNSPLSYFPTQGSTFAILSTGQAASASLANSSGSLSYQLSGLNNTQGNDLEQLTLVLRVPADKNCMSVDFAYYSEEFPEWVGSSYNDTFTAEFGESSLKIVGNEVVSSPNFAYDIGGNIISVNTVFWTGTVNNTGTTYDGVTQLLRARRAVTPGQTIKVVFSVQDLGDSVYDSAVFLDNFLWSYSDNCTGGSNTVDKPPILLVHGIMLFDFSGGGDACSSQPLGPYPNGWNIPENDAEEYFGPFRSWLAGEGNPGEGNPIYQARLTTSPLTTPTLQWNAACLSQQVDFVLSQHPGQKVILVAHSMGGLISRAYLSSLGDETASQKVKALYTFGSPHSGINTEFIAKFLLQGHPSLQQGWGVFCTLHQGVCQFSTDQMTAFNLMYPNTKSVSYTFVGGDAKDASFTVKGRLLNLFLRPLDGDNDGLIGKYSATGHLYVPFCFPSCSDWVRGEAAKYWTHETHGLQGFGSPSYFEKSDQAEHTQSFQCLKSWLVGDDSCASYKTSASGTSVTTSSPAQLSYAPSIMNSVNAGQTTTHAVQIDTNRETTFDLSWATGSLGFTLIRPDGQLITPTFAAANPNIVVYSLDPGSAMSLPSARYTFSQSMPGTWTLMIGNPGTTSVDYAVLAFMDSDRRLKVNTNKDSFVINEQATIQADVSGFSGGIEGLTVMAKIERSDGTSDAFNLTDLGNGHYSANYTIPNAPGETRISVVATGIDIAGGNISFSHQADKTIAIIPSSISLSGQYSAAVTDPDGNGLYDELMANVGVTASQGSEFVLSGELSAGGQPISTASVFRTLAPGSDTMTLHFDGDDIRLAEINGPYTLTNVQLIDTRYGSIPTQTANGVWSSSNYSWQQFGNCYTLTLGTNPSIGGIVYSATNPNCNNGTQYAIGTDVQLVAVPKPGFAFANWIVDANGSTTPITLAVDGDKVVKANFNPLFSILPPDPFFPNDLQPAQSLRPLFDWSNVSGATSYNLQVSTTNAFTTLVLNINVSASAYLATSDLPRGAALYWRVRSNSLNGSSAWSDTRSFTSPNSPSAPTLLTPANGAVVAGLTPTLDWSDSTFAPDHYEVQISTASNFSTFAGRGVGGVVYESMYVPQAALAPGTTYYWRVRAVGAVSPLGGIPFSEWSAARSFRTGP